MRSSSSSPTSVRLASLSSAASPRSERAAWRVIVSTAARSRPHRSCQAPRGANAALTSATATIPTVIAATRSTALMNALCGTSMSVIDMMPTV